MDGTDWSLIDFSDPKKAAPDCSGAVSHCPKCGKQIGRGKYLHLKHCKGPTDDDVQS